MVCDDQALIRSQVCEALASTPFIEVVGEASDGQTGLDMALELRPDVVIMDVRMPGLNGIQATRRLIAAVPEIKVLGHSAGASWETAEEMFRAGARGFVVKRGDSQELLRAIRAVANGMYFCSPNLIGAKPPQGPPGPVEPEKP